MKRKANQKRLIPLLLALLAMLVGAALAVPTINLSVQELGQGHATITSNIKNAKIIWTLDPNNPDYLSNVTVDLSDSANTIQDGGTIYVKLYDSNGNLIAKGSADLQSGKTQYSITLTLVNDPNNDGKIGLDEFSEVYVVYQGP